MIKNLRAEIPILAVGVLELIGVLVLLFTHRTVPLELWVAFTGTLTAAFGVTVPPKSLASAPTSIHGLLGALEAALPAGTNDEIAAARSLFDRITDPNVAGGAPFVGHLAAKPPA